MKILYIGDPHATPDSLLEMEKLVDLIIKTALDNQVDFVCFLGDQYHTHSIIHLSVLGFWTRAFKRMVDAGLKLVALVGNHDKSGVKGSIDNAMMLHANVAVIDKPIEFGGILFVPYIHDTSEFIDICNKSKCKVVVCHQTFMGSVFENGFLTPDGVEPNLIRQESVISGHIHRPQKVGKVWYIGAPRWRTVNDANTERAIWVVEHASDGIIVNNIPFDTKFACRPMYALTDTSDAQAQIPKDDASIVVDIFGTQEYVDRRKRELEDLGVRVRTFPESQKITKVRESDGLPVALRKFLTEYSTKNGTTSDVLWNMAQERISWLKAK